MVVSWLYRVRDTPELQTYNSLLIASDHLLRAIWPVFRPLWKDDQIQQPLFQGSGKRHVRQMANFSGSAGSEPSRRIHPKDPENCQNASTRASKCSRI